MQLEPELTKPLRILVIAAHPDDIEIGVGGSVARWTDAGAQVTFCLVTDGSAGSNDKDVIYSHLVQLRQEEQLAAAKLIGVEDVRFLGYPDGVLEPTLELRRDLTRLIRQIRPERVVITDPTTRLFQTDSMSYINHPDHIAAAEAALYAVFPSAESRPIFPELLEEGFEPFHVEELYMQLTEKPSRAVDITPAHDRKLQAVLCHRSQLNEDAVDWISKFDQEAGKMAGVEFAEVFRVMTFYNEPQAAKDDPAD
jgi:LmbE family N-acetylglucosaminyl deacetylase